MLKFAKQSLSLAFVCIGLQATASEQDIRNQIALGALAYVDNCRQCHQVDGYGEEKLYPSLHDPQLMADKALLIRTILHGRIVSSGNTDGSTKRLMPSLAFLTDQEIVAIIAFISNSWGDGVLVVSEQEVRDAR